jgi:predicted ATP-grasp superfamily ATP-dependent carboligase
MPRAIMTYSRGWHSLAICRSLGRQGIEVYCGEEAAFAPSFFSKYCSGHFQYPSVNDEPDRFIEFMLKKVKELKPDEDEPYILMPVHKETWLFAEHRELFEPHIVVPLTSYENMQLTHDKGQLALLADELGITIPGTRQFRSLDDVYRAIPELTFPVFLKMRAAAAGIGLKKCDTPEELTSTFRQFVDGHHLEPAAYPLVQDFIPGEDYCYTALYNQGARVADMTYHNVRSFPRDTGAGALRETVSLPEADRAAEQLLTHLNWHGMAQLDFRKGDDGTVYLIELNPRFFGGLTQSIAANVDYPHLLFRIASGENVEPPDVDYSTRTEAPVVGLLATLDEIAHDERLWNRFQKARDELAGRSDHDPRDHRLRPFWNALKEAANPGDLKAYFRTMFEKHSNTIDDVLQSDDPWPAFGALFPAALALKKGKLSMSILTGETDTVEQQPRRRLRDLIRHPSWRTVWLTALLYAVCVFAVNADATRNNLGWIIGFPMRLSEFLFGNASQLDKGTIRGALQYTGYHLLNLAWLYVFAALIRREKPSVELADSD